MIVIEIRHAMDCAEHARDLLRLRLEGEDVGPEELDAKLAFHAGQCLVDVVLDRLGKVHGDPRHPDERVGHGGDELVLVLDSPRLTRLQADVELAVVRAIGVGAVVWGAELGDDGTHLGEHEQPLPDLTDVRAGVFQRDPDRELDAEP